MSAGGAVATIELGGTKILCRVTASSGELLAQERFLTTTPAQALTDLGGCLGRAQAAVRIGALGVASFGPIDLDPGSRHYGRLLATPKPGWSGFDVRGSLAALIAAPIRLDTDVNAAALAEQHLGAGRGCRSIAYVTVGTGIGAGLVAQGETLRGVLHPELGHLKLARRAGDAHASTCPFHADCVEGLAAGPAVARRVGARASLERAPRDFGYVAGYLGELAAAVVLAWAPHRLVFGGGVMAVPGLLERTGQALRDTLNGYGPPVAREPGYLVAAELQDAGLEGALLMARAALAAP